MQKLFLFILFIILTAIPEKVLSQTIATNGQNNEIVMNSAIRENLVNFAKGFMGVPYRYASAAPENGFDCSGFVHYIFKSFDIVVPHSSKAFKNLGKLLKPDEFKIGDVLVFYGYRNTSEIGHVGIICEADGMKSKFIHSSSGKSKGVIISELSSEMYSRRFYQCVDIISEK
ncbi:MAG: C40 family peptidase [Draconibacterium sp.]